MRNEKINLNEMIDLAIGLRERGIEFNTISLLGGMQIYCKDWGAICHSFSYGHKEGLIDVYGLPQCKGDIIGRLTADEVLELVDEMGDEPEPADIDDDFGFDPYEGSYTYDC